MKYDALAREYATLWDGMQITRLQASIKSTAERIIANRARYETIQGLTSVPWYVVGVIHALETGLRFDRHLHNGDPLTAATKLVPKNRPPGKGPFTFEQSCCDALVMKGYDKVTDWTIERIAWALERYNGWGYRKHHPETLSPYLWSGTNHYAAGKYVADGKWSATAVSSQSGAMPLLKTIAEKCPDVKLVSAFGADAVDPEAHTPASNASTDSAGMTTGQKVVVGTTAGGIATTIVQFIPTDPGAATATITAWKGLGEAVSSTATWGLGLGRMGFALAAGIGALFLARWAISKWGPA
jgi:lysozyme family protein